LSQKFFLPPGYGRIAFSQEGEDLVLNRLFAGSTSGFYVDVGAHHPRRYSNTAFFYARGWRGINIDPLPDCMKAFKRERPRDINLECGVSDTPGTLTYYMFASPELNGFSPTTVLPESTRRQYSPVSSKTISVDTLANILRQHLNPGIAISFFSIDVEGYDLQVLKSNDWEAFRPDCVLVEDHGFCIDNPAICPSYQFLTSLDYELIAKTPATLIFRTQAKPLE